MSDLVNSKVVKDFDSPFVVDPTTRKITNKGIKDKVLICGDHDSERFTFEIPRFIEGRDVAACNSVQVHYINVGKGGKTSTGVYQIDDLNVYPFTNNILTCSWLISSNATKHEGRLRFMLRFATIENEAEITYAWYTEVFDGVPVLERIDSDETFQEEYIDIITQWKTSVMEELKGYADYYIENHVDVNQIGLNQSNIASLRNDLNTATNRLNNFANLPSGSTSADAELIDIRTGFLKNYSNAGEAVREQTKMAMQSSPYGYVFLNENPTYEFVDSQYIELTLNGTTEIFYNGKYYTAKDLHTKHVFNDTSGLFAIIFNYKTYEITIQHFSAKLDAHGIIIGTLYQNYLNLNIFGVNKNNFDYIDSYNPYTAQVWATELPSYNVTGKTVNNVYSGHAVINMPRLNVISGYKKFDITARTIECDINVTGLFNILYNIDKDEMIIENRWVNAKYGYLQIGLFHTSSGVYLNNCAHLFAANRVAIAPLILGWSSKFVEFDSVNKSVTFPDDTLIQVNRSYSGVKHYQLLDSNGTTTVSYADLDTTAIVIIFDTFEKKLKVIPYNTPAFNHQVVVASFRTANGQVSINAPYKWDGKPFNMTVNDFGGQDYNIEDFKKEFNVRSINHRGYCLEAPENTLSAYKLSARKGFRYVECDVSFTSDNIPVLLHDNTINRTSNWTGTIGELTLEQVKQYDFGSWFSPNYTGEKIPTFEEFIALCRKLGLHPYIEIKSVSGITEDHIKSIVNIVKRYGMKDKVTYISFE